MTPARRPAPVHGVDFLCGEIGKCATCYALPARRARMSPAALDALPDPLDFPLATDAALAESARAIYETGEPGRVPEKGGGSA